MMNANSLGLLHGRLGFIFSFKHVDARFKMVKPGSSVAALSCGSASVWVCVIVSALCFHIWASVGLDFDILSWDRASVPQGPACPFEKFFVGLQYLHTAWSSLSLGLPWDTRGGLTMWISRCSSDATSDCQENPSPPCNEKKMGKKKPSNKACLPKFVFDFLICFQHQFVLIIKNHGLGFSQM